MPSTLAQLQGATSIGELQRLFASANPPADAKQRAIREISFLREQLQEDAERLRAHLAEPDPDDPAPWLTEMKLQVKVLGTERSLNGLIRGDYCFGTYRRLDHPLFEVLSWPGGAPPEHALLLILDRDRPALYAQLTREIDRYEKVTAFNKLNEEMRRRVLFLRETSLREDPPEERRWLSTYFPEEFGIDELTAMIH